MKQSAWFLLATLVLVGCGGDEVTFVDETDSMAEETATTDSTTAETMPSETGGDTEPGEGSTDAPPSDAPASDAPASDAPATDGGVDPIKCGGATCNPATQVCCVATVGGMQSCIDKAATCAGGKLTCTSAGGCSGTDKCCLGTTGPFAGSTCKASCGITESELCENNADCTMGKTCKNIGGGSTLKRCE